MIFQSTLETLNTELSQLEALLNAKRQQRNVCTQLQQQTEGYLQGLSELKNRIDQAIGSDAIASLKSAVLGLFDSGDNESGGGNDPAPPTEPTPDTPTLLPAAGTLEGQCCHIEKELEFYWDRLAKPEGQAWDFASPLACFLKDKPADIPQPKEPTSELIHLSANCGYLKLKADGRILAAYAWFSRKNIAEAWMQQLEIIPSAKVEMRESKRNSSWKWELKITGLSMQQVERLASEKLHAKPSKPTETPAQVAGLEPPADWGKVQQPEQTIPILSEGDTCEVLNGTYTGQLGTVETVNNYSELPIAVSLPGGHIKNFHRSDVKLISKAEPVKRKQPEPGKVLIGNRVITDGRYFGVARRAAVLNSRNGTSDKIATLQLMKDLQANGLDPQLAVAATSTDDVSDF